MYQLDKQLKTNDYSRFHLLCGEEVYLIRAYQKVLKSRLVPEGDELNTLVLSGDEADFDAIADFGMLAPFMGDKRLIIVNDSGWFASGSNLKSFNPENDRLIELLGNLPDTTYIIFTERHTAKNNGRYAFFEGKYKAKIAKPRPHEMLLSEFSQKKGNDLIEWIAGYAAHNGKKITKKAAWLLVERIGNDMFMLARELDKVIGYTGTKDEIHDTDIDEVCGGMVSTKVYEMVDAVAEGNSDKALSLYKNLIYNKEDISEIMVSLGRQFNTMYRLKSYEGSGIPVDDIAKRVGMPDRIAWKAKSFMRLASKFSYDRLEKLVFYWVDLDEQVKTYRIERQVAAELFLIQALTNP